MNTKTTNHHARLAMRASRCQKIETNSGLPLSRQNKIRWHFQTSIWAVTVSYSLQVALEVAGERKCHCFEVWIHFLQYEKMIVWIMSHSQLFGPRSKVQLVQYSRNHKFPAHFPQVRITKTFLQWMNYLQCSASNVTGVGLYFNWFFEQNSESGLWPITHKSSVISTTNMARVSLQYLQ